jgi:hypothetical protein
LTNDFLDVVFGIAQGLEIPDLRLPSEGAWTGTAVAPFLIDLICMTFAGRELMDFQDENAFFLFCLFFHGDPLTYYYG